MSFSKTIFFVLLVFASTPLLADVRYRAGYEINFSDGGKDGWSMQTRSWLSTEEPVVQKFGNYTVLMLLGNVSDTTYELIITVTETSAVALSTELLKQSFEGSFTGVLEYSAENSLVSFDGAMDAR